MINEEKEQNSPAQGEPSLLSEKEGEQEVPVTSMGGAPADFPQEAVVAEGGEPLPQMPPPAPMPRQNVRALAEGAVCAGLVVALALLGRYLPVLGNIVLLAIPLPMVIVALRHGFAKGMLSVCAAGILLSIFLGPLAAISVSVRYSLLGLAFGTCFYKKYGGGKTFAVVTVVCVVSFLLGTLLSFWVSGIPVKEGINEMVTMVNSVFDTLENQEQLAEMLPPGMGMDEYIATLKKLTTAIFPAALIVYSMITVWLNYFIGYLILRKMGYQVTPLPAFSRWQMPLPFLWLAMAGLAFGIAGRFWEIELLNTISINLLYVTMPLFLLSGLSFICYYLQHQQIPMMLKTMVVLGLILFAAFGVILLIILGLCDTLFDWRQLQKRIV